MAIYLLFIQHIMHTLSAKGKAAIVVPTGFITAQSGIDKKIRQKLVKSKMLAGVVSMPSNIFATTGTNVSILFLDKANTKDVVLIDASNLGTKVKDGKNYSLSAGQYFEVKIEYIDISADEFASKMNSFEDTLETLFSESKTLEKEIQTNLKSLKYD
jgi:type I restriction enzyme M protein